MCIVKFRTIDPIARNIGYIEKIASEEVKKILEIVGLFFDDR